MPQVGHTRWARFGDPHCGQSETRGASIECCARRWSRRAFDVFRFGTAMAGAHYSVRTGPPKRRARSPSGHRSSGPRRVDPYDRPVTIDELRAADWPTCARIYEQGLDVGTFEEQVPTWERWDEEHLAAPRLAARRDGVVVGWAALAPVSRRECYRGVAENSVYVAREARGRGVGRALLAELVLRADAAGVWTIQAGILAGNAASVALHEACGFRVVGVRERLARKRGEWRDVVLMERRAP